MRHDPGVPAFRGFPPDALQFLRELEANNDREWFKANRARYDDHLVAHARALGDDLADLGALHLFRPWNDTRFHARPPIKEQLGLAIGYGGAGGFYVEPALVRAPRGYPADHPRVELLRHRGLTVSRRHELAAWLHRPQAGARIRKELEAAAPLVRWLSDHVGPSQRGAMRAGGTG